MRSSLFIYSIFLFGLSFAAVAAGSASAVAGTDDIRFVATLTDNEQSIPTYSAATGVAEVTLERETLTLFWHVTYKDLSSAPIEAGLYGPENVGANAGILIDIGAHGMTSPLKGSKIISDGELQYLINERIYVNIKTAKWPEGEIRGQLQRQPPK